MKQFPYKLVAIAGTFDRLHKGHRHFISEAFKYGERVVIGLTSDKYISNIKYKISNILTKYNSFSERKEELVDYLKANGILDHALILKINDMYGPAIEKESGIEALMVTAETLKGGEEVNRKRIEMRLAVLKLIVVDLVDAEDKDRISSTRIRGGEIDREGRLNSCKLLVVGYKLPERIRIELKRPQGRLIQGDPENLLHIGTKLKKVIRRINSPIIITVGDEVTRLAIQIGLKPQLCIVDFKVNRKEKYSSIQELGIKYQVSGIKYVKNEAGYISKELVEAVEEAIRKVMGYGLWVMGNEKNETEIIKINGEDDPAAVKDNSSENSRTRIIKINGEDDLAAVPAIVLAPLGAVVIYGQPGQGVVLVEVTEEKKKKMVKLLHG